MTASWSVALSGVDGFAVEVEAAKGGGLPKTLIVGLPDKALSEAKERVKAAVRASGFDGQAAGRAALARIREKL